MKQPAQQLGGRVRIWLRAAPSFKARPSLGTARGSPRADMAVRKCSEWGTGEDGQGGIVGGRREVCKVLSMSLPRRCAGNCLSEGGTLNRQPRVGPNASGLGSKPGFSSQPCPDRSSLFPGLGGGQALPTLLALIFCDAGAGSRVDRINPYTW